MGSGRRTRLILAGGHAPRIEFAQPVRTATVNGEDWRYLEGGHVFLPSLRGDYDVRVEAGVPSLPSVTQTRLTVTACRWDAARDALHVTTESPQGYTGPLPGGIEYTLLVDRAGWTLVEAEGAELVPVADYPLRSVDDRAAMRAAGTLLRLSPGEAVLHFTR